MSLFIRRLNARSVPSGVRQVMTMPQLSAAPQIALADDKICITASGLTPNQKVTVSAVLKEKATFTSCGHFVADKDGCVDLKIHSSIGGTYTGVDGMGLLWSMRPAPGERSTSRLIKSDVTKPFSVRLSLLDGHVGFDDLPTSHHSNILASVDIERWYKQSSVQRIIVREGDLRGTLFLPPGDGPFPGVIDMFGSTGGLVEFTAALLASRGFAAFALGFLGYDDLPTDMNELDLDYFLQAVDWMSSHPAVRPGGIGVLGVSKGGELGMLIAAYSPKVKAVVSVNGAQAYTFVNLKRGGQVFFKGAELELGMCEMTDQGIIAHSAYPRWKDNVIPIWLSDAKFLLLSGEEDKTWDTQGAKFVLSLLSPEKRKNVELKYYPGAGHLIEPPYAPMCYASFHKIVGVNIVWGGIPHLHAIAQEDCWKKALKFLRRHLSQGQCETASTDISSRL